MAQIYEQRMRQMMDEIVAAQESLHRLMVELSVEAGFYRKRATDVVIGDVIGVGENEWWLVSDVTPGASPEGQGLYIFSYVEHGETGAFYSDDIVDVRAEPDPAGF
jgi:hypothetical protein